MSLEAVLVDCLLKAVCLFAYVPDLSTSVLMLETFNSFRKVKCYDCCLRQEDGQKISLVLMFMFPRE